MSLKEIWIDMKLNLDEVRKIVYNDDRIIEYSIAVCEYERVENVKLLEKCN